VRIIVTGSRERRDYAVVSAWLRRAAFGHPPQEVTVVHGAATGVDHLAHSAAIALGFTPEPHFPDYALYAASVAPKMRNQEMVDAGGDVCLAFPSARSRGTWDCVTRAKKAGIHVEVINEADALVEAARKQEDDSE
jgi:hypothetical protein